MAEYFLIPKRLARAAPALGRTSQWLEAQFAGLFLWMLGRFSPEHAAAIAATVFRLLGPYSNKSRAVKRNLRVIYPKESDAGIRRLCREIFGYLGVASAELAKMEQIWQEREQRIAFDLSAKTQAHLDRGEACVFVTAHVGAWQLTNLIARRYGLSISTVYAAESNPAMQRILQQLRSAFGVKLVPSEAGVKPLIRELAAGNSIGLAVDTRLDRGQLIPFFGVDACTNTSAARLALRSGAALIPIRARRLEQGRFLIQAYDPIARPESGPDSRARAIAMTELLHRHFEDWIRETPEQWMCLKRRWPKSPAKSATH